MDATKMTEYTIDELADFGYKLQNKQEELEAAIDQVKKEIAIRLDQSGQPGQLTNNNTLSVTKVVRTLFSKVPMDKAKELGATVTKEVINNEMLRNLFKQGIEIPGMIQSISIVIKPVESKE
jgi:hypothetical protein